jgi:hypothetical protein
MSQGFACAREERWRGACKMQESFSAVIIGRKSNNRRWKVVEAFPALRVPEVYCNIEQTKPKCGGWLVVTDEGD